MAASWPQPCWVTAVAFQPNAEVTRRRLRRRRRSLWDWPNQKLLQEIRAHKSAVSALAFSADGLRLASAGEDQAIHLWDTKTARPLGSLIGHTDRIPGSGLASRRPAALLRRMGHHRPRLGRGDLRADHSSQQPRQPGPHPRPERRRQPVGVRRFGQHHPRLGHEPQPRGERTAAAGPRDPRPGLQSRRPAVGFRRRGTHHPLMGFGKGTRRSPPGRSADHAHLPRAQPGQPATWPRSGPAPRWASGKPTTPSSGPELQDAGALRAFAASPDGKWIAGSRAAEESALALWDAATGRRAALLEGQAGPVTALAFSADSCLLATGGPRSGDVWLWNIPERRARTSSSLRRRRLLGGGVGVPSGQARAGGGRRRLDEPPALRKAASRCGTWASDDNSPSSAAAPSAWRFIRTVGGWPSPRWCRRFASGTLKRTPGGGMADSQRRHDLRGV